MYRWPYSYQISISYPSGSAANRYGSPGQNSPLSRILPPARSTSRAASSMSAGSTRRKPKWRTPPDLPTSSGFSSSDDVVVPRGLDLRPALAAMGFDSAEHRLVEARRPPGVLNGESDVGEAVGPDHAGIIAWAGPEPRP